MSYPATFCTRPFNELHIEEDGRITPCCVMDSSQQFFGNNIGEYLQSDRLKRLKKDLAKGEKPTECSSCWKAERFKQYSHRTVDTSNPLDKIVRIHIRYNNFCNFKCRICNPTFSSSWAKENEIHQLFPKVDARSKNVFEHLDKDHFFDKILPSVNQINISGGEPLITPVNLWFLDKLREYNYTDISIAYNTNLSSLKIKNVNLLDEFEDFSKLTLTVSIDGWGKHNEYHRHGLKWNTFLNNFKLAHKYIYNINSVVSIYSVYTIPDLLVTMDKLQKEVTLNPVNNIDNYISIQSLPRTEKEKIIKHYETYECSNVIKDRLYDEIIKPMSMTDYSKHNDKFFKNTKILDKIRGENFPDVFPQYKNWWEKYHKAEAVINEIISNIKNDFIS